MSSIRLHIPAIPYSITREEYTDCAFTGKVLRFGPMMQSRGFEVYHYGIETSAPVFDKHVDLLSKDQWTELRIKTFQFIEPALSYDEAKRKNEDPLVISNSLSNWGSPLSVEFNKQFKTHLKANYRSKQTDIVCIPLGHTYDHALNGEDYVVVETGIGYSNSCKDFRVFESHTVLAASLKDTNNVHNYWFVIPNYYNIQDFTPVLVNPTKRRVGFLGRVATTKGCRVFVEIARRFPNVTFVLCGPGHPEAFLNNQVPNVIYEQPVRGEGRSRFLGSCAAILCPSQYLEPFCGVSVEAQLCGTPVISADHGAFADNVEHGKTGLRCHTLADYCHGVQLALDGKFDRTYIAETSRKKFDMYHLAKDYEYVFQTVLDVFRPKVNGWYAEKSHYLSINDKVAKSPPPHVYLVIPYFGSGFPSYFQLYLDSLAHNADVLTVIMPTDLDLSPYRVPANLIAVTMSMDEVRAKLARLLRELYGKVVGPDSLLREIYKLVDVKITYPLLFADLLIDARPCDFVGWGDIDVIYGKLSHFIESNENYDIIGGWHGHFTAILNTDEWKRLFLKVPNYFELVIDNSRVYIADEIQYREPLVAFLENGKKKMCFLNASFCDIIPPCFYHLFRPDYATRAKNFFNNRDPEKNIRHLFYNVLEGGTLTTTYDDGSSYETSYCHLQKRTMESLSKPVLNGYYIVESRFAFSAVPSIPMQIFQTWKSWEIPLQMCACIDTLKEQNPEFAHYYFDDACSQTFLQTHFQRDVVNAYDALIPGAYKADLWRYCILYIHGGLYLDVKLQCADHFRLLHLYNGDGAWCDDGTYGDGQRSIYNGILMSEPGNPVLWNCIQRIVKNVADRFYGTSPWMVTGPQLLGSLLGSDCKTALVHRGPVANETISLGNKVCLVHYPGYRQDVGMKHYYRHAWDNRAIYTMPSIHVFVASIGKPSIHRILDSLRRQLTARDFLTIVFDGPGLLQPIGDFLCPVTCIEEPVNLGFWGHAVRNKYQPLVGGDFVFHVDDDDDITVDCLSIIKAHCVNRSKLYIFQMKFNGDTLWKERRIQGGNIGTPCGLIPITAQATFSLRYGGDCDYYKELTEKMEYEFVEKVIYVVKPLPLNLFQTWESHVLPPKMQECVNLLKKDNPTFRHVLFDNQERRQFIADHFSQPVLDAYDALLPPAFKADLWRCCVLFIHGGIYLDIKYHTTEGFSLRTLLDQERYCLAPNDDVRLQGVYNAILVCRQSSPILQQCIDQIVKNVQNRIYGDVLWDITGPTMMRSIVPKDLLQDLCHGPECIQFRGKTILRMYPDYYSHDMSIHRLQNNQDMYPTLWKERRVFDSGARIVLLLTSTVQVGSNISWLRQTCKEERLQTYLDSVQAWLRESTLPIVLVENSGFDFGMKNTDRFEVISYDEKDDERLRGNKSKGISELVAINYAYEHSRLLQDATFVVKLTGRYFVPGLESYLRGLPLDDYDCLTQNDPNRCEMVGAHRRAFQRIFRVDSGMADHVEDEYKKRTEAEAKCLRLKELHIKPTMRGGDGKIYDVI